eukprot:TRINITY_DN11995_c0_g1_i1.p1 TRINITY_DN11995_c0_g1~~TRINITY_DN11995_c0_g1_i1.p1  ORF type:complete len:622 (+),score=147.98 TRINITY_DN11995_c0_g1_i1:77-1867(+)
MPPAPAAPAVLRPPSPQPQSSCCCCGGWRRLSEALPAGAADGAYGTFARRQVPREGGGLNDRIPGDLVEEVLSYIWGDRGSALAAVVRESPQPERMVRPKPMWPRIDGAPADDVARCPEGGRGLLSDLRHEAATLAVCRQWRAAVGQLLGNDPHMALLHSVAPRYLEMGRLEAGGRLTECVVSCPNTALISTQALAGAGVPALLGIACAKELGAWWIAALPWGLALLLPLSPAILCFLVFLVADMREAWIGGSWRDTGPLCEHQPTGCFPFRFIRVVCPGTSWLYAVTPAVPPRGPSWTVVVGRPLGASVIAACFMAPVVIAAFKLDHPDSWLSGLSWTTFMLLAAGAALVPPVLLHPDGPWRAARQRGCGGLVGWCRNVGQHVRADPGSFVRWLCIAVATCSGPYCLGRSLDGGSVVWRAALAFQLWDVAVIATILGWSVMDGRRHPRRVLCRLSSQRVWFVALLPISVWLLTLAWWCACWVEGMATGSACSYFALGFGGGVAVAASLACVVALSPRRNRSLFPPRGALGGGATLPVLLPVLVGLPFATSLSAAEWSQAAVLAMLACCTLGSVLIFAGVLRFGCNPGLTRCMLHW